MSYYATTTERLELIAGLHALAKFLEENEDIPVPKWTAVMVFPEGSDNARRSEIDSIATRIGAIAKEGAAGHYTTSRTFGPVEYHAVAIPANPEEA